MLSQINTLGLNYKQKCRFTRRQPSAWYGVDNSVEMTRALCYGGTVMDKRPIFQPIIMWVAIILSSLLRAERGPGRSRAGDYTLHAAVRRIFPLTLSDRGVWRVVVLQRVGCGQHSKGHLYLSRRFVQSHAAKWRYHHQAPSLVHSSAQTVWLSPKLGSLSFLRPPTVRLLTWPRVVLGPGSRGTARVVSLAVPHPEALLSVGSASVRVCTGR